MFDDPVYDDQLAAVAAFHTEHGRDADLAGRVLAEWGDLLGCQTRDVITVLRIADLTRFCVVRGLDPPASADDYDTTDDLTLLATAVGQLRATGDVQPVLRMAGLAALDRLAQVSDAQVGLEDLRSELMSADI
jgi:hypothetical protein